MMDIFTGKGQSVLLLGQMQVRTLTGKRISYIPLDITGSKSHVQQIFDGRVRTAFERDVKDHSDWIAVPENVNQMIQTLGEGFDLYDTQVVIIELLINDSRNSIANTLVKKLQFNGLHPRVVRELMKLELDRIERQCQDVITSLK